MRCVVKGRRYSKRRLGLRQRNNRKQDKGEANGRKRKIFDMKEGLGKE